MKPSSPAEIEIAMGPADTMVWIGGLAKTETKDQHVDEQLYEFISRKVSGCKSVRVGMDGTGDAIFRQEWEASNAVQVLTGMKFKNEKLKLMMKSGNPSTNETKIEDNEELKQLKKNIIVRKRKLKIDGFTGGQVNKDDQISKWSKKFDELANKLAAQHYLELASLPSQPLTP